MRIKSVKLEGPHGTAELAQEPRTAGVVRIQAEGVDGQAAGLVDVDKRVHVAEAAKLVALIIDRTTEFKHEIIKLINDIGEFCEY